jgi:hypothetical protein
MKHQKQTNSTTELPEWLTETPEETKITYHLEVETDHEEREFSTCEQDIDLTRDEYDTLKQHLGVLRGLVPEQSSAEPEEREPASTAPDPEYLAMHQKHLAEATERGKAIAASSPEFADMDELQFWYVVGLIDLLKARNCSEGIGASWLGRFIADMLLEVAGGHLAEAENQPAAALTELREYIRSFELDISEARELAERYEEFEPIKETAA